MRYVYPLKSSTLELWKMSADIYCICIYAYMCIYTRCMYICVNIYTCTCVHLPTAQEHCGLVKCALWYVFHRRFFPAFQCHRSFKSGCHSIGYDSPSVRIQCMIYGCLDFDQTYVNTTVLGKFQWETESDSMRVLRDGFPT